MTQAATQAPQIITQADGVLIQGSWTTVQLKDWLKLQPQLQTQPSARIQADAMDTNGAWLFLSTFGRQPANWPSGLTRKQQDLLSQIAQLDLSLPAPQPALNPIADLGRRMVREVYSGAKLLNFLGQLFVAIVQMAKDPRHFKPKLFLDTLQRDGLHAVPIIALLSFLLGAVVAYQGGVQLSTYGANIFIVELVALTHLRELGPLIAAILVAGRSGSAYAAQIATMKMNQELLALRSLGQDPFTLLVLPKLFGLLLVLPLLTVLADLAGLAGGMLVASMQLDITPMVFWQRLAEVVNPAHFWVGLIKAPVFALIIVNVGCMQGFQAPGGAEAVGQRTTRSVVQAIFLVILVDALFSIPLSHVGW